MFTMLEQQGTKQRLLGLEQMEVRRAAERLGSAHAVAAASSRAQGSTPTTSTQLQLQRASTHDGSTQVYAREHPINKEQLSSLVDVSDQLLNDNNYKASC